ncbi:HAD-IA family hydrolase [Candidatus Pelagibacter sp.]|nr:HAD-IA family hydrolase [Candidatus Pelagibacter sp.]
MINLIIFDLDGVLVDTKKNHYIALNEALKKFGIKKTISYEDHLRKFDGLPTYEKLKILNKEGVLDVKLNKSVHKYKQIFTKKSLLKNVHYNKNIFEIFKKLSKKVKIAIATNATKTTLDICINKLKIRKFIDFTISNENLKNPKPNPEIYLKVFIKFGFYPKNVLIIEDSFVGREAAISSGANLLAIKHLKEVNYKNIINSINKNSINLPNIKNTYWEDENLNILIPMAGAGSRFADAGYIFPKPLIEIDKKPMIQWVVESLNIRANYIFIIQKEHQKKYNIKSVLQILKPNCKIVELDSITEGAACTTLLAKKFINNNNPLIIANSDQYVEWNSAKSIYNFISQKLDGAILTFKAIHPKWSYAKCDKNDFVEEVAEKKVISNNATVGVYYWNRGSEYVKYAEQMIKKNIRVGKEFYVCPVFNEAIKDKKKIKIEEVKNMWGLGTPEDLNYFLQRYNFKK